MGLQRLRVALMISPKALCGDSGGQIGGADHEGSRASQYTGLERRIYNVGFSAIFMMTIMPDRRGNPMSLTVMYCWSNATLMPHQRPGEVIITSPTVERDIRVAHFNTAVGSLLRRCMGGDCRYQADSQNIMPIAFFQLLFLT
jgi:hypothetical protein